jgi:hypothetical protein
MKTIDCEADKEMAKKHGIQGFPTFRYYPKGMDKGNHKEYSGARNYSDFVQYLGSVKGVLEQGPDNAAPVNEGFTNPVTYFFTYKQDPTRTEYDINFNTSDIIISDFINIAENKLNNTDAILVYKDKAGDQFSISNYPHNNISTFLKKISNGNSFIIKNISNARSANTFQIIATPGF